MHLQIKYLIAGYKNPRDGERYNQEKSKLNRRQGRERIEIEKARKREDTNGRVWIVCHGGKTK